MTVPFDLLDSMMICGTVRRRRINNYALFYRAEYEKKGASFERVNMHLRLIEN